MRPFISTKTRFFSVFWLSHPKCMAILLWPFALHLSGPFPIRAEGPSRPVMLTESLQHKQQNVRSAISSQPWNLPAKHRRPRQLHGETTDISPPKKYTGTNTYARYLPLAISALRRWKAVLFCSLRKPPASLPTFCFCDTQSNAVEIRGYHGRETTGKFQNFLPVRKKTLENSRQKSLSEECKDWLWDSS